MAIKLFDFIDTLFSKSKYKDNSRVDKTTNFFMSQRIISIKYPIEANRFNKVGVNLERTMDFWNQVLTRLYSSKPKWVFTSTAKAKEEKKDTSPVDKNLKKYYMKLVEMSEKDFKYLELNFRPELDADIKILASFVKENKIDIG